MTGRDAEAWLAARGIVRDPITAGPPAGGWSAGEAPDQVGDRAAGRPSTTSRTDEPVRAEGGPTTGGDLGDEVSKAVAFVRRSTANTPQSEARLRRRLVEREHPRVVVDAALLRAREEGLVDDAAMAAALVEEGRRKGHAPLRLRADLERRELPHEVIDAAVDSIGDRDLEAAAFAVARDRARRLRGVQAETAFRRVVGHLARRGYPDAMARKVARLAIFDDREPERVSGH